jgi:hypothetical protein
MDDKEKLLERLKDQLLPLLNQPGFEDALKGARAEFQAAANSRLPRLKVMACPMYAGKHPLHDSRYIVTDNATIEWNLDETEWAIDVGSLIADMRDSQHQSRYARMFAASPDMLDALEGVVSIDDISKDVDIKAMIESAKAAIRKAKGEV